jgi:ribosomal protein S6--L-glutamate ligase
MSTVAFLLGRPPSATSVLHDVRAHLASAGVVVTEHVLTGGGALPDADLHVLKDLPPAALRALAATRTGSCSDLPTAVLRCEDKLLACTRLHLAGVPLPATRCAADWAEVPALAGRAGAVVKPRFGTGGRGVLVLDGEVPAAPATPGPWLVQERVPGDGRDRKLYVVGDRVHGVLRTWPAPDDRAGTPFPVPPGLTRIARAAADALDLTVCGIDVVLGPAGPVVVDVNPFPGFKGVPGAAELLAAHLLRRLSRTEVPACAS